MLSETAIEITNVSQFYKLYGSPTEMALDALGLNRFTRRSRQIPVKKALNNISLTVKRGDRIGLIGRNGAGKTTLLKLLTGNYVPSSGKITINGKIQSLMSSGLGFHPDLTGYENVKAALIFNNLSSAEAQYSLEDIIDFTELDEYIHQPFKTYSLGMQSRLAFATSTAIKPDILIIDEVLGAGDAYFATKSAQRMKELTKEGSTLLLVSHSMGQVLQFCDKAVWLHNGEIESQGAAMEVIKQYDKYIVELEQEKLFKKNEGYARGREEMQNRIASDLAPNAQPSTESSTPTPVEATTKQLSKWLKPQGRYRIEKFEILNSSNSPQVIFKRGDNIHLRTKVTVTQTDAANKGFVALNVFTPEGTQIALFHSEFSHIEGQKSVIATCTIPQNCLGDRRYVISVGVYEDLTVGEKVDGIFSEIWDRSYEFEVQSDQKGNISLFHPPHEWHIGSDQNG